MVPRVIVTPEPTLPVSRVDIYYAVDPDALARGLAVKVGKNVHVAQMGPLSLTQVTERGTVYSLDELRALDPAARAAFPGAPEDFRQVNTPECLRALDSEK
mgnify:CR=1 FL=1